MAQVLIQCILPLKSECKQSTLSSPKFKMEQKNLKLAMLCEIRNLAYIYTGHTVYSSRSNGALITSRWDAYSYSFPASLIHFSHTPYIGVNDCTTEAHRKLVLGIMMVPFSERQNACCALVVFSRGKSARNQPRWRNRSPEMPACSLRCLGEEYNLGPTS